MLQLLTELAGSKFSLHACCTGITVGSCNLRINAIARSESGINGSDVTIISVSKRQCPAQPAGPALG
jgi:hypothetical protein